MLSRIFWRQISIQSGFAKKKLQGKFLLGSWFLRSGNLVCGIPDEEGKVIDLLGLLRKMYIFYWFSCD